MLMVRYVKDVYLGLRCGVRYVTRCHKRHAAVRWGTVWYGTMRYGTIRCGAVRYDTMRQGAVRTVQHGAMPCDTVQYSMVWCDAVWHVYDTVRCGTVWHDTKQYDEKRRERQKSSRRDALLPVTVEG